MVRVTLHDIAKRAGVSVATVSLALRGRGELSKTRVAEIRAIADKMGYRPNPMLAALASKRFSNAKSQQGTPIAIFDFPPMPGKPARKPSHYKTHLIEEATRLGYAPSHFMMTDDTPTGPLFRQLYSRSTQGIIITGNLDMTRFGKDFDWGQFAVVQCARYLNQHPFHIVRPNIFQSVKLCFTKVREAGYERIGCALGRHSVPLEDDEDRLGTALSLETSYLPRKHRLPVYQGDIEDRKAFMKWCRANRPDAVLGFNILHYHALREEGIRMPEDVGFALLHEAEKYPDIAGMNQNVKEIARQSVLLMDQLIRNHDQGPTELPIHILIPSTWQSGPTVRS